MELLDCIEAAGDDVGDEGDEYYEDDDAELYVSFVENLLVMCCLYD